MSSLVHIVFCAFFRKGVVMHGKKIFFSLMLSYLPAMLHARTEQLVQQPVRPAIYESSKTTRKATYHATEEAKNASKYLFVELSGGVFRPSASILHKIYGSTWPAFQFKVTFPLFCKKIHGWIGVNYAAKSGKSLGGCQKTKMHLIPISFGLRGIVPIRTQHCNLFSWYAGIAAQAVVARIWNDSDYVDRHTNGTAPGVIFETGFYIHPCRYGVISLGIDYNIARLKAQESCIPNVVSCPLRLNGLGARLGVGFTY
jgi:hypothetical protein